MAQTSSTRIDENTLTRGQRGKPVGEEAGERAIAAANNGQGGRERGRGRLIAASAKP